MGSALMQEKTKALLTVTFIGLTLLVSLLFQVQLTGPAGLHFFALCAATLLFSIILLGLWIEETWAYQLSSLFFAGALADIIWMFTRTNNTALSAAGLLLSTTGMIIATTRHKSNDYYTLETYDLKENIRDLKKELESIRRANKKRKR